MTLFADDISIVFSDKNILNLNNKVNETLRTLNEYFNNNHLILNVQKSSYLLIGTDFPDFTIKYENEILIRNNDLKILGIIFDNRLSFHKHIDKVSNKISIIVNIISRLRYFLPLNTLKTLYNSLVVPNLTYVLCVWGLTFEEHIKRLIRLQKCLARLITFKDIVFNSSDIIKQLNWLPIEDLIKYEVLKYIYKHMNGMACDIKLFEIKETRITRSHNQKHLLISNAKYSYTQNCIFHKGVKLWNQLDIELREAKSYNSFINKLKIYFNNF